MPGMVMVIGAGGFVGRHVVETLGSMALPMTRQALDLGDAAAVAAAIEAHRPRAVVNAAAWADVDICERDPAGAFRVNAEGPGHLAAACARRDIRLVHISTDYVFGGPVDGSAPRDESSAPLEPDGAPLAAETPAPRAPGPLRPPAAWDPLELTRAHRPGDPCAPVNRYGASKVEGERRVLEAHPAAMICRTAWVYGRGGKGFGCSLPIRLARGERVPAIADRFGHPTYVRDLVACILGLLEAGRPGIFHGVNGGTTSWYEFSRRLAERLGLPPGQVEAMPRDRLPPAAPRPHRIALIDPELDRLGLRLRPWQEAQDAFLRELVRGAGEAP
jgi:dTDP-4-dehydrorhamnose reductase